MVTQKQLSNTYWKRGFNRKRCAEGHKEYPKRNTVESVNHAFKTRHTSALRSKLAYMKKRELAWHILIYNIDRILRFKRTFLKILLLRILDKPLLWMREPQKL